MKYMLLDKSNKPHNFKTLASAKKWGHKLYGKKEGLLIFKR
jgi:hypothetical protein